MKLLLLASTLVLGGCLGPEAFVREAGDRCLMAGYAPGTAQYSACSRVTASNLSRAAAADFKRSFERSFNSSFSSVPYANRYSVGVRYY